MIKGKTRVIIQILVASLVLLLSMTVCAEKASSAEFHSKIIETLDDKKDAVMGLITLSTAGSVVISAIPEDTGTAISNELADLSSLFLIVLCAIYLEKYSLTLAGIATFKIIIPVVCLLYMINLFYQNEFLKKLMKKLFLIGITLVTVVPVSVKVSDLIDDTYMVSIENTLESGKQLVDAAEDEKEGVAGILSNIKEGISSILTKAKNLLNGIVEGFAILIITSCVIPIFTILFFIWLIKMILGIDININFSIPKWAKKAAYLPKNKIRERNSIKNKIEYKD